MLTVALSLALFATLPAAPSDPVAPTDDDQAAIERAILDYAESYYEARPDYVERGISKDLAKLGFRQTEDGGYEPHPMTYDDFVKMIDWVVENGKPEPGPKEVVILDAMDKTALVKLTGVWGIDYMQVTKEDDAWQTRHVLWQTFPPERDEAQVAADRKNIEAAVRDYVLALYQVEPERIARSVHPELVKYGFWRDAESGEYKAMPMTFDELHALAGRWNADGHLGDDAPQEIEVLDLMDQTACAKLTAAWGIDYMHLAWVDGRWQILQVLWQSAPEEAEGDEVAAR